MIQYTFTEVTGGSTKYQSSEDSFTRIRKPLDLYYLGNKVYLKITENIIWTIDVTTDVIILPDGTYGFEETGITGAELSDKINVLFPNEGSGSTSTLAATLSAVLVEGHQTGGNDIDAKNGSTWNGARLVVGPNRAGFGNGEYNNGGDKGVTQYCANGYALDFQNGEIRHRQQGSNAPKPLPTISPIKYTGTIFDGLINTTANDPILATTNIDFIGDFAADFETYFNYTSTFRVYCYDVNGTLLAIGKYDGVNYVDPLTTLYLYQVTNIVEGATINQIVKVAGYDWNEDTLITQRRGKELFVEKATQPLEYVASITQVGTDNPTVVEASTNTLTGIAWQRLDIGLYSGTLASVFTANKTFIWANNSNIDSGRDALFYRQDAGVIGVKTYNANIAEDNVLVECSVRIVVYP